MKSEKFEKIYKIVMLIIITVAITFFVTTIGIYNYIKSGKNPSYLTTVLGEEEASTEYIASVLQNFRDLIDKEYVGEINEQDLLDGAIKGYISGLNDPYSEYYTKEEMSSVMEETEGEFIGIGVYITTDIEENKVVVVSAMKDYPADKAGIKAGDYIVKVDGVEYTGEQIDELTNSLKGEENTTSKIEILRDGETQEIEVKREKVKVSHIDAEMLDSEIGYIDILSFDGDTATEFETKYNELVNQGMKKLIIDVRNNGGGVVEEALNIADLMVDKDKILLITKNKNEEEEIRKAQKDKIINIPVVILANEYSASASEILVAALKEQAGIKVIGKTTYGKGVIQTLHMLADGSGVKLTTEEYYTPNRNKINKIGITPDIEVSLDEKYKGVTNIPIEDDLQLQMAIEEIKKE